MNLLYIFSIILLSFGCEKPVDKVYSIRIENKSNDTIQFYASYVYPDTSIVSKKPRLDMAYPNDYSHIDSKKKWEDVLPNNIISIFILSKDTVDTYNWENIRSDYNILRRYDLSIEQLESMNWTVTYQ